MMDRGRPSRHEQAFSASTTTAGPAPPSARRKPGASPNLDSVRRKPVPLSVSSATAQKPPPLSSGGIVVAVGEDEFSEYARHQSSLPKPPSLASVATASPTLVPRDLDQ